MREKRLFRHPSLRLLEKALQRELYLQLAASVLLTLGGGLLLWVSFGLNGILSILALVLIAVGGRWAFYFFRQRRVGDHRLFRLLTQQPGEIVWVYSIVTERLPFGFQFRRDGILYFKLRDGDEISVGLPADKLKLVSHTLQRLLPHAAFGYSREREQQFTVDPQLLLRRGGETSMD